MSELPLKIGVVGSGFVGATCAFAIVMRGVGREIVLVDRNEARARAEANDIYHAVPFSNPLTVQAGGYPDLAGCRVVIIAAGVAQKSGETRLELLRRNSEVLRQVVPSILEHAPEAVLVMVSNPVDIMTHLATHYAAAFGVPPSRVIGSGTMLDTARYRALLGRHYGIDPQHVHGYVVGEHGDSEVLTWSQTTIAGVRLAEIEKLGGKPLSDEEREDLDRRVRGAAYEIIAGKGSTYYGIASAVARLVEVLLHDQRAILTITSRIDGVPRFEGITFSLPHVVGGQGVLRPIPLMLADDEAAALERSAAVLGEAVESLKLS